jgi:hypothetical protein
VPQFRGRFSNDFLHSNRILERPTRNPSTRAARLRTSCDSEITNSAGKHRVSVLARPNLLFDIPKLQGSPAGGMQRRACASR